MALAALAVVLAASQAVAPGISPLSHVPLGPLYVIVHARMRGAWGTVRMGFSGLVQPRLSFIFCSLIYVECDKSGLAYTQ